MVETNAMNIGITAESLAMELPTMPAMVEIISMLPAVVLVLSVTQVNAPQIKPSTILNRISI